MPTNNVWGHESGTQVQQVSKQTVASASAGQTFSITLTDEVGRTETISYTVTGSEGGVDGIAAAIIALWNASALSKISRITASVSTATVILTADTAGVPYTPSYGGTGTWTDPADDTDNVGNNDAGTARNWSENVVPTGTNTYDVIFPAGSVSCKYGMDFHTVTATDLLIETGFSGDLGRFEDGIGFYLQMLVSGVCSYRGSGQLVMLDLGASAVDVLIEAFGSPSLSGRKVAYLKGTDLQIVRVNRGTVGIAALDEDSATVDTIIANYITNQRNDVNLQIGKGCAISTELRVDAGICLLQTACPLVSVAEQAELTTEGDATDTIDAMNVWGRAYPNSIGTITALNIKRGGYVDMTRDMRAKTVSAVTMEDGATLIYHDAVSLSTGITVVEGEVKIRKIKKAA